ncbi:MAG: flavodoxin family protein [Archaeoglobales archaeon]|nr:flavodoxin family protein [Archaeoglobales archaeon]
MKVLGLCGSPRKNGNTETALRVALDTLKDKGIETEIILLAEKKVEYCDHCGNCLEGKQCPKDDDAKEIFERMQLADGIIVASPVYYTAVPAQLKALFDRSIMIRKKLAGKVGGAIAVGQVRNGGQEIVCEQIHQWMITHEMFIVPIRFGGIVLGSMKDLSAAKRDEVGLNSCRALANKMAETLLRR